MTCLSSVTVEQLKDRHQHTAFCNLLHLNYLHPLPAVVEWEPPNGLWVPVHDAARCLPRNFCRCCPLGAGHRACDRAELEQQLEMYDVGLTLQLCKLRRGI